jgi:hypothetical protein
VTVPSAARRRPPGRYDPPPILGQRVLAALLTVLALAVVAAVGAYVWDRFGGEQVRGQVRTFEVRSDREVVLELEVAKSSGARAYCVIRARGADGLEVGRDIAVLDAEGTSEQVARGTFVLATSAAAVTGELAGCTAEPISRDDPAPSSAP